MGVTAIKTSIKNILDAYNTTTSSPDLSGGMARRVQKVLTYNLERIPIQASWWPFVTCYIDNKDIVLDNFAKDQNTAKRKYECIYKIVGGVYDRRHAGAQTQDLANDELELLMENVESILRKNPDLSSTCLWSYPTTIDYFSLGIDEETHLRTATMTLKIMAYY